MFRSLLWWSSGWKVRTLWTTSPCTRTRETSCLEFHHTGTTSAADSLTYTGTAACTRYPTTTGPAGLGSSWRSGCDGHRARRAHQRGRRSWCRTLRSMFSAPMWLCVVVIMYHGILLLICNILLLNRLVSLLSILGFLCLNSMNFENIKFFLTRKVRKWWIGGVLNLQVHFVLQDIILSKVILCVKCSIICLIGPPKGRSYEFSAVSQLVSQWVTWFQEI